MVRGKVCETLILVTFMLVFVHLAEAQQPKKIPRIGYLVTADDPGNLGSPEKAFRQGLRDLGYIEGENILIEYRSHEGKADRIPSLVAELVRLKVDVLVLVTACDSRSEAGDQDDSHCHGDLHDPVATGIVDSLARPGGNITGLTRINRDLNGKRLELLKEVIPTMSRVGVLKGAHTEIFLPCAKGV